MKFLKGLGIVVLLLVALILIMAAFVSKDFKIEREVVINKPTPVVFDYIKYLKNQDQFSYWAMQDPGMKKEYKGTDGTVGFTAAWNGEKMGVGEQEIKAIQQNAKVDYELRFKKPMEATNTAYLATEALGASQTKVKWALMGHSNYPMNIMNLVMKGTLENQLQTGLDNLKKLMEKQ